MTKVVENSRLHRAAFVFKFHSIKKNKFSGDENEDESGNSIGDLDIRQGIASVSGGNSNMGMANVSETESSIFSDPPIPELPAPNPNWRKMQEVLDWVYYYQGYYFGERQVSMPMRDTEEWEAVSANIKSIIGSLKEVFEHFEIE